MHTATHLEGFGQLGPVLDNNPLSPTRTKGELDMWLDDGAVFVSIKNKGSQLKTMVIPFGNIVSITLKSDSKWKDTPKPRQLKKRSISS